LIFAGVAASLDAAVHRLQLAQANQVAFPMLPLIPDHPLRHPSNTCLRQLTEIHARLLHIPTHSFVARFSAAVTCHSLDCGFDQQVGMNRNQNPRNRLKSRNDSSRALQGFVLFFATKGWWLSLIFLVR
jgi:hypothetical protein